MRIAGKTFGIVGALAAFPRRLAAREVSRQGGVLRRGAHRKSGQIVFGRRLLDRDEAEIEAKRDALASVGTKMLSENGFLRALGLLGAPEGSELTRRMLLDQSGLDERTFDFLALFDAFEHDTEPFSFRDLIVAKKYAGLVAGGASWSAVARSVHKSGTVASLTRLNLHASGPETIHARHGDLFAEVDGQHMLTLPDAEPQDVEDMFFAAEQAEAVKQFEDAAALYLRCLALDPGDSVAAYNRANCLRDAGHGDEAVHAYAQAIKLDGGFVEAWFNFGNLLKERGQLDAARRHLSRAIALDPKYEDAVYNLAALEYDAGNHDEARRWWTRYLELDKQSAWARKAERGIQYIDLLRMFPQKTAR